MRTRKDLLARSTGRSRPCRWHARIFVPLVLLVLLLVMESGLTTPSFPVLAISNVHVSSDDTLPHVPHDSPYVNETFRLTRDTNSTEVFPVNEEVHNSDKGYIATTWSGAVYLVIVKNLTNSTAAVEFDPRAESARGPPNFLPTEGFTVQPGETKWQEYTSNYQCGDCGYSLDFDLRLVNATSENATATGWWFVAKTKEEDTEPLSMSGLVVSLTLGLVALVSLTKRKKKGQRYE